MHHRLREQVNQFEDHAGSILAGNLTASLMLVFLIHSAVDNRIALSWLGLHTGFNLIRFLLTVRYRSRVLQTEDEINARYRHYRRMIVVSGLIWGLSAFLLFPANAIEYQLLYLLVIVGFTATAMSLVNILPKAYPLLLLLIFAPIYFRLAHATTEFSVSLSLVLTFFILFMLAAAQAFRRNLIEAIELRIKLRQQAIQDVLTGIYNRRYFMEQLKAEWNRCMRHQQPITIIIIDIDHFKKLNDRYGHKQGDECLIEIARLLNSGTRRTGEFVARIGGEEFAIVLPNAKSAAAIKLAEKLRNDLSLIRFSHKNEHFHISASMGIACTIPNLGGDCERLFEAADEALYQAKDAGRNRYQIASFSCDTTP